MQQPPCLALSVVCLFAAGGGGVWLAIAFFHMALFGLSLRSSIMTAIYDKSLKLAPEARRRHSTGSIVTMYVREGAAARARGR